MRILWLAPGVFLVVLAVSDAIATTLSTSSRAGPLTRVVTMAVWRAALAGHRRRPCHRLLAAVGPALLVAGLAQWLGLLWAGWTAILLSRPGAVLLAETGEPAGWWDVAYFAGVSLFSLGTGDVVGAASTWRLASVLMVASGLFVLTLSLSYFVSVVGAASDRRVVAARLDGLGGTPQEIVLAGWRGTTFSPHLGAVLGDLVKPVPQLAEQHVTYHVLHYFHSPDRRVAVVLGLARLDEALTLLEESVDPSARPDPLVLAPLRWHLGRLLQVVDEVHRTVVPEAEPPEPDVHLLRRAGVPLVSAGSWAPSTAVRRRALAALVASDGWSWADVDRGDPDGATSSV